MTTIKRDAPLAQSAVEKKEDFWETAVRLSEQRLTLLASNIANADTPNYKARDLDFRAALNQAVALSEKPLLGGPATGNTNASRTLFAPVMYRAAVQGSVDGNTVEMDQERSAFAAEAIHYEVFFQSAIEEYKEMSTLFKDMKG